MTERINQPQREEFFADVANILSHGHTLITHDVKDISQHYGYTGENEGILVGENAAALLAAHGVCRQIDDYKGRRIYRDSNVPIEQTDINVPKRASTYRVKKQGVENLVWRV